VLATQGPAIGGVVGGVYSAKYVRVQTYLVIYGQARQASLEDTSPRTGAHAQPIVRRKYLGVDRPVLEWPEDASICNNYKRW
jgi:hypothetical protein